MQPPIDSHASDLSLPKFNTGRVVGDDLLCFVYKRYKYVTLVFRPRLSKEPVHSYTIHQVDARGLAEALSLAVNSGADYTFLNRLVGGCEGFNDGGPPEKEQLVEFMSPDEQETTAAKATGKVPAQETQRPIDESRPWWRFW